MLSICSFIGLVHFEDKDFWIYGGVFCVIIIVFIVGVAVFVFNYVCFYSFIYYFLLSYFCLCCLYCCFSLHWCYYYLYYLCLGLHCLHCYSFILVSVFVTIIIRVVFFLSGIWLLQLLSSLLLSWVAPSLLLLL